MKHSADKSLAYLGEYYVTRNELARMAGISATRIVELVQNKCIPPHCYEIRPTINCVSTFGDYQLYSNPEYYYHKRHIDWIERALVLARIHSLGEVAETVKETFFKDLKAALGTQPAPWPAGMEQAWTYLMDGTWGLCLINFDIEGIVDKELARKTISNIVKDANDRKITALERKALTQAVNRYNRAALPFSPHEVGESSRILEIAAVVEKFGL